MPLGSLTPLTGVGSAAPPQMTSSPSGEGGRRQCSLPKQRGRNYRCQLQQFARFLTRPASNLDLRFPVHGPCRNLTSPRTKPDAQCTRPMHRCEHPFYQRWSGGATDSILTLRHARLVRCRVHMPSWASIGGPLTHRHSRPRSSDGPMHEILALMTAWTPTVPTGRWRSRSRAADTVWANRHAGGSGRCVCPLHGSQMSVACTPACRSCVVVFTAWANPRAASVPREGWPVRGPPPACRSA